MCEINKSSSAFTSAPRNLHQIHGLHRKTHFSSEGKATENSSHRVGEGAGVSGSSLPAFAVGRGGMWSHQAEDAIKVLSTGRPQTRRGRPRPRFFEEPAAIAQHSSACPFLHVQNLPNRLAWSSARICFFPFSSASSPLMWPLMTKMEVKSFYRSGGCLFSFK